MGVTLLGDRPEVRSEPRPHRYGDDVPTATAVDGTLLTYDIAGSGPPLILVHGITESGRTWDPLLGALTRNHRVVTVDLRGHGRSGSAPPYDLATFAADVNSIALSAGMGPETVLVGHSLGGLVVTAYAAAFACRAVVNVDQPLDLVGFQTAVNELAPMLQGDEATFRQTILAVFDSMRGPLSDADSARIASIRRPIQAIVLGIWAPLIGPSTAELDALVRSFGSAVAVPYLALHGIDPGPDYRAWLTELIPTAIVEIWPDHGHYPHLVDSPRFLQRLAEFEQSLPKEA